MLKSVLEFLYPISDILLWILLALDFIAFFAYGIDKRKAKRGAWRISEKTLLTLAFFGGIGAWCGMKVFHHKTKHLQFRILLPLFAVLQLVIVGSAVFGFYYFKIV